MNIKYQIGEVVQLIDKRLPVEAVCKQLQPLGKQTGLNFAEPATGAGYLQWTLPGEGWIPFTEVEDNLKPALATLYQQRKADLAARLEGSPIKDQLFSVPSPE